jgi:hypothetical protein
MQQQQMQMQIDIRQTKGVTCSGCGGLFFKQAIVLRRVPALMIGQAHDSLMPIPVFRCDDCHEILEEFMPRGLDEVLQRDLDEGQNGPADAPDDKPKLSVP